MAISKRTLFTSAALVLALGLSGAALTVAYVSRPAKQGTTEVKAVALGSVAGVPVDGAAGDRQIALASAVDGGNTRVEWTCGKAFRTGGREDHHGSWKKIQGAIAFNAKAGKIKAIEAHFAADSFTSDQDALTNTVVFDEAWFDTKGHPTCDFTATAFEPIEGAKAGEPNTTLKGKLTINGIGQDLAIPAVVAFAGESVRVAAKFEVSRSRFKVEKRESSALGTLGGAATVVDDAVHIHLELTASPDAGAMIAELGRQIEGLRGQNDKLAADIAALRKGVDAGAALADQVAALKAEVAKLKASGGAGAPAVKLADLPKTFDDAVPYSKADNPSEDVPFTMVLVPGDEAKGIGPFYMGETEVLWSMFRVWAYCEDLAANKTAALKEKLLRPSPCYGDCARGMGTENKPAVGMSRLNAEKFCQWLSEQTGRIYRLPTEAEWDLAYALGGGDPADKDAAAVFAGNASKDELGIDPVVAEVKSKEANKLGLYDMLGNAAEWVKTEGVVPQPAGNNSFIRGGSFKTAEADLTGKSRAESAQEAWNKTYPQTPKSLWWYKDRYDMGFRLVCEPVNLPKKK